MTSLERRNFILEEISKSIASQIENKTINKTVNAKSVLSLICKSVDTQGKELCEECLKVYLSDPEKTFTENKPEFDRISKTACSGLCYCDVSGIDMNQNVLINSNARINESDLNVSQVVKDVEKAVSDKYGASTVNDEFTKNITKVVTSIQSNAVTNINQVISSMQTLDIQGTGVSVKNVSMNMMINATMNALTGSNVVMELLTDIVTEQMSKIREQVNSSVVGGFKKAITELKNFLIGTGVTFIVLIFLIVFLLIYRAIKSREK